MKFTILIVLFLSSSLLFCQKLAGNEWIDYSKEYYKIPVVETGIYRVSGSTLELLGVDMADIRPSNVQFYFRGKPLAVLVEDEDKNNYFDANDYIDFMGFKNDGTLDNGLFDNNQTTNPYYNLFSDTTAVFFTDKVNPTRIINSAELNNQSTANITRNLLNIHHTNFGIGIHFGSDVTLSSWVTGKGWMSDNYYTKQEIIQKFNLLSAINNSSITLRLGLVGKSNSAHVIDVSYSTDSVNYTKINTINFYSIQTYNTEINIPSLNLLSNNKLFIKLVETYSEPSSNNPNSYFSLIYSELIYQTVANTNNKTDFEWCYNQSESLKTIAVTNHSNSYSYFEYSDLENIKLVAKQEESGTSCILVLPESLKGKIWVSKSKKNILGIKKVNFKKIVPRKNMFLIVSHPLLTNPSANLTNPIKSYADYRASINGGGYSTEIALMPEIYDQFSYGETTPLAIKGMMTYLTRDLTLKPAHLFLIGQAVLINYSTFRKDHNSISIKDLVPTYTTPGSDWGYTMGLDPSINKLVPIISTGRLSASFPDDVENYLNKIKEYELEQAGQAWHKNVVLLSGGNTENEISYLKRISLNWESIVKGNYWGANVAKYHKTSSGAVQVFDLSKEVNDGTRLVAYMGHAEINSTDINIGNVSDTRYAYNNKGKYTFMILNGCNTGNNFVPTDNPSGSIGLNWLRTPNKGAIGELVSSSYGYIHTLERVVNEFLQLQCKDSLYVNKSIGEIYCKVFSNIVRSENIDPTFGQAEQCYFESDPSIVLFPASKPDFEIVQNETFVQAFDNTSITAVSDSFKIGIVIKNLGMSLLSPYVGIQVKRISPNGSNLLLKPIYVKPIINKDTVYYTVYSKDVKTFGDNFFEIKVDFQETFSELNEYNNIYLYKLFLSKSSVECIYPRKYSIVTTTTPTLVAQSTDLLSDKMEYFFELDTTLYFNSPIVQRKIIEGTKLPEWRDVNLFNSINTKDSTVFFWRVRYNQPGKDTLYGESSFTYINNGFSGWTQSHYLQNNENQFSQGIKIDTLRRKAIFKKNTLKITASTAGDKVLNSASLVKIVINNTVVLKDGGQAPQWGANNGLVAMAIKQSTLEMYRIFDWPCHTISYPYIINNFPMGDARWSDTSRLNYNFTTPYHLFNRYLDSIPFGDYVLVMSSANANMPNWGEPMKKRLQNFGATKLEYLTQGVPYLFLGQKGKISLFEITPDSSKSASPRTSFAQIDDYYLFQDQKAGFIETNKIGPANEWGNLVTNLVKDSKTDVATIDIYGVTEKNETMLVKNNIKETTTLLSEINATQFPYLKLRLNLIDTINLTPTQIKNWTVSYSNITPEGSLIVDNARYNKLVTLPEGAIHSFDYSFKNISQNDFKAPLIIQYTLKNVETGATSIEYDTIKSILKKNETISKSYQFNSKTKVGTTILQIYVNPQFQQEEYFYNNLVSTTIKVEPDKSNPIFDVTFDGIRIMNGEIVSPKPSIEITMNDENTFIPKQDTLGMNIWIKKNCETCVYELVNFSSEMVKYYPASRNNKNFKIEYKPARLEDGIYTLKVQGQDGSKNKSSMKEYLVQFRVINESSVTRVFPYPNPFTDYTRFVFTLTGEHIPDEMKIQIMTITGRIIREINQDEIGILRIGTNISSYAWDGRDEFGDKLANGVYLYKVDFNSKGNSIKVRNSVSDEKRNDNDADKSFKNEIGKLVIIR